MALKELEVRYATRRQKDYKLADGEGLYLLVRPNGSKLWRMKYRFDGREKLLSFGRYPISALQTRGCAALRPGWRCGRAGTPEPAKPARPSNKRHGPGRRTAEATSTKLMPRG